MNYSSLARLIKQHLPNINVHLNHSLAPYTTLKIGGPADLFVHTTKPTQFLHLLKLLYQNSIKDITILGQGSNVLISDSGVPGLVIKNSGNYIRLVQKSPPLVKISSGTSLPWAINHLLEHQITGLQTFAYIPATLGGAIYSNIHGTQFNFSQLLESIETFNLKNGKIQSLKPQKLSWGYDSSPFQNQPRLIILSAVLKLQKGNPSAARQIAQDIIAQKSLTQPLNSAGCVFKNLPAKTKAQRLSAGKIIDSLGLKGKTIGNAQISPQHANFIVNLGGATASDYLKLARFVQKKVKQATGLQLKFEIKLLGKF